MAAYELRHRVGFEETSLVGNVYFSNYLLWQGHCRERFLHDHAPETLDLVKDSEVALFTRKCSCDFTGDWGFTAADEVIVRMELTMFRGGRMELRFQYFNSERPDEVVASGEQSVSCKKRVGTDWVAAPFPPSLIKALMIFADDPVLVANLNDALDFQQSAKDKAG